MSYHYTDPSRENDPHALPDVEVFRHNHEDAIFMVPDSCLRGDDDECSGSGWYYAYGSPGCLWDSGPVGPFETEEEALEAAREYAGGA